MNEYTCNDQVNNIKGLPSRVKLNHFSFGSCIPKYTCKVIHTFFLTDNKTTYLVVIVPPVAAAVMNRITTYNQNHGTKAVAIPLAIWMKTAMTNGIRRPILTNKTNTQIYMSQHVW